VHTRKHCYPINVIKFAITLALETSPQISNQDLSAFHYSIFLSVAYVLVTESVAKQWKFVASSSTILTAEFFD